MRFLFLCLVLRRCHDAVRDSCTVEFVDRLPTTLKSLEEIKKHDSCIITQELAVMCSDRAQRRLCRSDSFGFHQQYTRFMSLTCLLLPLDDNGSPT
jgi:hypothetical protein